MAADGADADALTEVQPIATGVENINVTIASTANHNVYADKMSGVANLTVTRENVIVGSSSITGNKEVNVQALDASKVAKVTSGAGTTNVIVVQATKAGATIAADTATGSVTVTGAATVSAAGAGAGDTVTVNALSDATEDAKNVTVTTGAETVSIGIFTGSISVTGAATKNVVLTGAAGGATITALGEKGTLGTDGIVIAGIDNSGVTVTTSYVGVKTATVNDEGAISLAGGAATDDVATVSAAGVTNLKLTDMDIVNLSGNGAAVEFVVSNAAATKYLASGEQTVNLTTTHALISGKTATGVNVLKITDATSDTDLSKVVATSITLAATQADTKNVKVATGAVIDVAKDQTSASGLTVVADKAKSTVTIRTADDTAASGATITIDAAKLTASSNLTTVNVEANVGKLTVAGDTTLAAAADLNVSGSKDVNLGTLAAAKTLNAAALTGKLTVTAAGANTAKTITSGSANDAITLNQAVAFTIDAGEGDNEITVTDAAEGTSIATGSGADKVALGTTTAAYVVSTGAGDDEITIGAATDSVIDGGDGSDTVKVTENADVKAKANFALLNIEKVDIAAGKTLTVNSAQFAADNAFALTGAGALVVVGKSSTAGNTIDASNVTRASGVTGTVTLEGNAKTDIITGTAKDDTINATKGGDTIDAGTGIDTIVMAGMYNVKEVDTAANASNGVVVNLGTTAVSNVDVLAAISGYTGATSIAAGSAGYVYGASGATNSAVVTSVTGVENVIGTDGRDYIVASSAGSTITGGKGNDYIKLGTGADTVAFSAVLDNGLDVIAGFTSGTDVLKLGGLATLVGTIAVDTTAATGKILLAAAKILIVDDAAAADWSNVVAKIAAAIDTTGDVTGTTAIAIDNGTDTRVYLYQDDLNAAAIEADELTLVGTVTGVTNLAEASFAV
jgi:Ca2+-binding RTX toxin-like protein